MKKYFFLIAVMVVVFLGWGNVVVGQDSVLDTPSITSNDCDFFNQKWIEARNMYGFDASETTAAWDLYQNCKKNVNNGQGEPCPEGMASSLAGKDNAIISIPGVSCKCAPGYGELYNPTTKETTCELCTRDDVCCGIKLNTSIPFIGNCLEDVKYGGVSGEKAFPVLMGALTQILVTVILIVSFILIIIGGIMISTGNPSGGKKMIIKVVVGIAILGASGVILRLINPNFFG